MSTCKNRHRYVLGHFIRPSLKKIKKGLRKVGVLIVTTSMVVNVHAATYTWDAGSTTDYAWGTATNWDVSGANPATPPTAADDVVFVTPIPQPNNALPNPDQITLAAGSLANSIAFNDSYTLTGGDLTLTGTGAGAVTVAAGKTATINSSILVSGTLGLNLSAGTGTLVLGGANTFVGGVNVGGATLSFSASNNLGDETSPTNTLAVNGGTLVWTGATAADLTANRTLSIGAGGATINTTGAGALTLSGVVSGSGSLTKSGTGTLVLSGTNLNSGAVNLNGGILSVASSANLGDASATNNINFGGGTLQVTGATVDLGSNRTVNVGVGGGTIDTGANAVTISGVLTSSAGNALTKIGTGTLSLTGSSANTTAGAIVINNGIVALNKTGVNAVGTGGVNINSNTNAPATLRLDAANQIDDAAVINLNANGGVAARFDLNGFNETVGGIVMASTTFGSAHIATGAGILTLNGDLEMNNNRNATGNTNREVFITGTGSYGTSTPSGTLDLGGAVRTFNIKSNNTQANNGATIETVIQNGGIIKTGNTALLLRNNNTFTGGLTVNQNVVDFAADNNLGGSGNVLTLNGGGLRYNAGAGLTFARTLNIGANGGEIGVAQTGGPLTFSTADLIKSTGATTMIKSGAGTLNLNAANPNLNATSWTVSGGTLVASSKAALGTASSPGILLGGGGLARLFGAATTSATAGVNGLNAYYYNFGNNPQSNSSQFASDQLLLGGRVLTRIDTNPAALDLSPATDYPRDPVVGFQVPDNLGIMWKGLLNITSGGNYTFEMSHDDHASLFIDGQELLANAGNTGGVTNFRVSSPITLASGAHSIVVKFTQGGGGKYFRALYSGADTGSTYQVIGSTAGTVTTGSLAPVTYGAVGGSGTMDIYAPSTATGLTLNNGDTFTLTSPTIDNLTITGASTLNTATTAGILAPTSGGLIFNAAIGESTAGSKLTIAGPYLTQFNATNTYTGITTVTGGRLELNATGGNAIAGDLDLNAANTGGMLYNVQLKQNDQIANTAAVTVRNSSILDVGNNTDTIGSLNVSGNGQIVGLGTLNISNLTTSVLSGGRIEANLGGGAGGQTLTKTGTGILSLFGNNSFIANTAVSAGVLALGGTNSLGAATNTVDVAANAVLAFTGGKTQTLAGVNINNNGTLYNVAASNTLASNVTLSGVGGTAFVISGAGSLAITGTVTSADNTNLSVDGSGDVILRNVPSLGTGIINKTGAGFLIFNTSSPLSSVPTATVTGTGGLGFGGTHNLGSVNIPTGTSFKFLSDPGAGTSLSLSGGTVVAPTAITQTFVNRISGGSSGALALTGDSTTALNFTGLNVSLGAANGTFIDYSGAITPGGAYRFGGGGGELRLRSVLSGTNDLNITGPGVVYLYAGTSNSFTGNINVDGGRLRIVDNDSLGNPNNQITLSNGGKLTLIQNTSNVDNLFAQLGNGVSGAGRQIIVGTGGGEISVESYNQNGNRYVLSGTDPLSGSGALLKSDNGMLSLGSQASFSGALTIGDQGGSFEMRSGGALPNVGSVILRNNGVLILDNKNGLGSRQFASGYVADRINDSATIDMRGGQITFRARNTAGQTSETLGVVSAGNNLSIIRLEKDGQGSDLTLADLTHATGAGTIRFDSDGGTFGATGNNPRVKLNNINGSAAAATNLIGGWATINNNGTLDWAAYNATTGVVNSTYTAVANVAFTPAAANVINLTTAGTATLNAGNQDLLALRFGVDADQTLAFSGGTDTLYIGSGGVLELNKNRTRNIGASATRGLITAGTSSAAAGAKELFFHINQGTTNIESSIVDNNGAVTLIKDMNGVISLNSPNNTYSGGTKIYNGRINVLGAGALGTGAVLVQGSALELRVAGATTNTSGIIARDQSEIYLQNGGIAYNGAGDRYIIEAGSTITGPTTTANRSISSLTRVTTLTGPGQVILQPEAIVRSTDTPGGDIMTNMIGNLGNAADLYYNQSGGFDLNQYITVGTGTPWKGISSSVSNPAGWDLGTIYANGDFWLQGLQRLGGNNSVNLGKTLSTGSYAIVNNSGQAINAFVTGQVVLNEDTPVSMPNDLTFVVTKDGNLQANYANSFGDPTQFGSRASVLVRAGGTLDPGNYTPINPYNDPTQVGMPYALPSPVNTNLTVQAGGRLLLNDGSGAGSTTGGAVWTMKTDSILEVGHANVFLGSTSGLINNGQIVFEPGAIYRQSSDVRVFKLDQFVSSAPGGQQVVYEVFGGDRNLTESVNPFVTAAVGTPTVAGQDLTISGAGMITNDSNDRHIRNRRGTIFLGNGATLAATTQTYLYMDQNFSILPGANVNIGYTHYVDGLPKLGTVRLSSNSNNTGDNTSTVTVLDGAQLLIDTINVFPDSVSLHLPGAASSYGFPSPVSGSQLALNSNGNTEFIGKLTGAGVVYSNQDTVGLGVGWNANSDFTFDGVIKAAWASGDNRNDPRFIKVGPTKMTLTNTSDSLGDLFVYQGDVTFAGANGRWTGGTLRVGKGSTLTFDNTTNAVANRYLGTNFLAALGGGDFRLLGHATDVADVTIANLANSTGTAAPSYSGGNSGGFGKVTVIPSGDLSARRTSVTFGAFENFGSAGERNSVWLIRGVGVGGLPGTYTTAGVYTPNAANPKDGLVFMTNPNLLAANNYGQNGGAQGFILGGPGSPVAPVRGDLLASSSPTATEGEFATIDVASGTSRTGVRPLTASEYTNNVSSNASVSLNLRAAPSTAINTTGDTRFQVIKMENGSSLNVSGTLPALTQSSQIVLNGGGILVPTGSTASINASGNAIVRTNSGVSAYVHAFGDLNVTGEFFSDIGLVKTGNGTATFAAGSLDNLRGRIVVHEGTVSLNDSLANVRNNATSASSFDAGSHLELNGGTLNLNGKSQYFNRLESGNILAGAATEGGTLTSVAPATVTIQSAGTFSGHITGAISLDKVGNNALMLTNTNTMTGNVRIRQGTLTLRDGGTLPNVSSIDINYARLDLDNAWLTSVPSRLNSTVTLNMRGGDFVNRGHAGESIVTNLGTVNAQAGANLFQTVTGGGGSTETVIANLVRSPGSFVAFQQNYGFIGTAGNDSSAIRVKLTQLNGGAVSLTNNILPAYLIVNNDHFATYNTTTGISYLSNTEDGYANYDNTNLSTASATTGTQNFNDGSSRTIVAGSIVNAIRNAGAATFTLSGSLTINSGGLITNTNNAITYTGGSITSGTTELYTWIQQNTTTFATKLTGAISYIAGGSGTTKLQGPGNDFTGTTYAVGGSGGTSGRSGALQLDVTGANGTTVVAVPHNLWIGSVNVSELQAKQLSETTNLTIEGVGGLDLVNAAGVTETINSVTFLNAGGDSNARGIIARSAQQITSRLNLTGATPITATNDNPVSTPTISQNVGLIGFTGAAGSPQTLMVNSPVSVNGLAAAGLILNGGIVQVPTGVADGGLVKDGTGLLIMGGNVASTFGAPASPTDVFNIKTGWVRADAGTTGVLGGNNAITTVQNSAGLLLNGGTIDGSVRLRNGSTLGVTIASSTLGATASTGTLEVPSGAAVSVEVFDHFVPSTNTGNITVNHKLTGSGTINLSGILYASGYNNGGVFQLQNTGDDFSGTINVATNTVLAASAASGTGNTLGTASINLNGGVLRVRDQGDNTATAQTITYGNNVTLNADSLIDVDRQGTVATDKTIAFGTLTIPSGTRTLSTVYGTSSSITANNFHASFNQVAGAGTLVKGGTRFLDINGYDGSFSGNITVAGQQGMSLSKSGNLVLNAATNNLTNFTVNGFHEMAAGKTVAVSGVIEVGENAGSITNGIGFDGTNYVPVTSGSASVGSLLVNTGATVTTATLRNKGIVGPNGGAATLTATDIVGTGLYNALGNDLTLQGRLANDGANPSTLRVTGTNTVHLIPTASATATGGVEVQNGILRIAPTANIVDPLPTTGNIRVFGQQVSNLSAGTQAVNQAGGVLSFDGGANTITQNSGITNNGTVRVASGTVSITGAITGTSPTGLNNLATFQAATVPGLLEGTVAGATLDVSAARPANTGTLGVTNEVRMGQTNVATQNVLTGWADNMTYVYTGYFYDADGKFTFAENIDDSVLVSIDGVTRLTNTTGTNPYQTVTSTATTAGQRGGTLDTAAVNAANVADLVPISGTGLANNPNLPAGWHSIEIRLNNGNGGAGAVPANGFTNNFGFGLNSDGTMTLDGTQFFRPIDNGSGNLFRTLVANKGTIDLLAGATLNAGSYSQTATINLPATSILNLTNAAGVSDADNLSVTGAGTATYTAVNGSTATIQNVTIAAGSKLALSGGTNTTIQAALTLTGDLDVNAGTVTSNAVSTGTGAITVNGGTLRVNGSVASATGVTVKTGGTFTAGATQTVKALDLSANNSNATILAGALRILTVGDGSSDTGLLTLTGTGSTLDLNSGAMVLNFNSAGVGTSLRDTIKSLIGTGKIMSSRAVAANLADPNTPVGIGYALGDYTAVGLPSDATSIVTRYTLVGDANLDGVVDVGDLGTALAPNYGSPSGNYWQSGDFNGDGAVDTSDLALLAANYGKTLTLPGDAVGNLNLNFEQDLAQAFASVPEPGTLSVLGLAALALLKRRNRRAA